MIPDAVSAEQLLAYQLRRHLINDAKALLTHAGEWGLHAILVARPVTDCPVENGFERRLSAYAITAWEELCAERQPTPVLTPAQRSQALYWYTVCGYDLGTIAQEFGITRDQLARALRNIGG